MQFKVIFYLKNFSDSILQYDSLYLHLPGICDVLHGSLYARSVNIGVS